MEFVDKIKCFVISVVLLLAFSGVWGVPVYIILCFLDKESIIDAWMYGALCFLAVGWIKDSCITMMKSHRRQLGITISGDDDDD